MGRAPKLASQHIEARDNLMKYQPTPRDLLNPPPQARVFHNAREIADLVELAEEIYPQVYDDRQKLLLRVLQILNEHDEIVFRGIA